MYRLILYLKIFTFYYTTKLTELYFHCDCWIIIIQHKKRVIKRSHTSKDIVELCVNNRQKLPTLEKVHDPRSSLVCLFQRWGDLEVVICTVPPSQSLFFFSYSDKLILIYLCNTLLHSDSLPFHYSYRRLWSQTRKYPPTNSLTVNMTQD